MPGVFLLDARRCLEEDLTFYRQFTSGHPSGISRHPLGTFGHPPGILRAFPPGIFYLSNFLPESVFCLSQFLPESFFT